MILKIAVQEVCHGHHIDEHFQRQLPRPQGVDSDADASASDEDESGSASGSTVSGLISHSRGAVDIVAANLFI